MPLKIGEHKIMEELNTDFLSIYNSCNEQNLSLEDLNLIIDPLKKLFKGSNLKIPRLLLLLFLFTLLMYWVVNLEILSWYATAAFRTVLIQILPIWDWRYLHKTQCLLPKVLNIQKTNSVDLNCDICEHLTEINRLEASAKETPNLLQERYLNIHEPIIVQTNNSIAVNLTDFLISNADFLDSIPCDLSTNLFLTRDIWMDKIIERTTNPIYTNWFIHFRNCELKAVKYLRLLHPRGDFLPYSLPRTHTNWILLSQNYNGKIYKTLSFEQNVLILFEQIEGLTNIELIPREQCIGVCGSIKFQLKRGEILIYISKFWEFKYKGDAVGFNSAVAEEIYWD